MGIRTVCQCDTCDAEIDLTSGDHPARMNVYAPTPASVGPQQEESILCQACWDKLCATFPRFKEAERFAVPALAPASPSSLPSMMDSWSPEQKEQFLLQLGASMGVAVVKTPDVKPPPKADPPPEGDKKK